MLTPPRDRIAGRLYNVGPEVSMMRSRLLSVGLSVSVCIAAVAATKEAQPATATRPATTTATTTTQASAPPKPANSYSKITEKDAEQINFDLLPGDMDFVTPVAADLDNLDDGSRKRLIEWTEKLNDWAGAKEPNVPQRVRNLLHICALADMAHSEFEGETAYVIFEKLKSEVDKDELIKSCLWAALYLNEGRAVTRAPELGWDEEIDEDSLRERAGVYAAKLAGRLLGKLPKKEQ
jgi:hypothetical protein